MNRLLFSFIAVVAAALSSYAQEQTLAYPDEKHLKNLKQLTFGGDNAEAYWSFDSKKVVFQSNNPAWGLKCDQIFYTAIDADLKSNKPQLLSTSQGRTTCAYFLPKDKTVLYASTHLGGAEYPAEPERRPGGK